MPSLRRTAAPPRIRPLAALIAVAALAALPARLPAQTTTASTDYTRADVDFMQGMIIHHAQAVVMSDWAASHGARSNVLVLCKRIALSQRDEITLMQNWLRDRHLAAPDPLHMLTHQSGPIHDTSPMHMPGMDMGAHPMMMNGMLTPAEMRALHAARGPAFDRLYLTGMITHHRGALEMVATLFDAPGAAQQSEVFTFATDVDAGQRAEIARMQAILTTLTMSQTK